MTVVECWLREGKKADAKHSPSYGQNGQLVQSWGLVHRGQENVFLPLQRFPNAFGG